MHNDQSKAGHWSIPIAAALIGAVATVVAALIALGTKPAPTPDQGVRTPEKSKVQLTPLGIEPSPLATQEGRRLCAIGDYAGALPLFRQAAETGDGLAMSYLGLMNENGLGGLPKNMAQAGEWYRQGATAGNSLAMCKLASMIEEGMGGMPRNLIQAREWYLKAAVAGNAVAMSRMGFMCQEGIGIPVASDPQALVWYQKGAAAGDALAMSRVGYMYHLGKAGLKQDYVQSLEWARRSAAGGNARGMNNLGILYENGLGGLTKDLAQAVEWYRKAMESQVDSRGTRSTIFPDDPSREIAWYVRACNAGAVTAALCLGNCYADGRGVPKDLRRAVELYRRAAGGGNPEAALKLVALTNGSKAK